MKSILPFVATVAVLAGLSAACPALAQTTTAPAWASARAIGAGPFALSNTAVDAAGNTYEAGSFSGSLTIDGVVLTSQGSDDGYLARYSPTGNLQWVRQFASPGPDRAIDVAVDAAGTAYVVGSFSGGIALGNGSTLQLDGNGTALSKAFVVCYSPQGTPQWVQQSSPNPLINSSPTAVRLTGVDTDSQGNVYATGDMTPSVTIGTTTIQSTGTDRSTFLCRLSATSGALRQLTKLFEYRQTGYPAGYSSPQLAVAPSGRAYVFLPFFQSILLGNTRFDSRGDTDVVVMAFSPQGTLDWSQQYGAVGPQYVSNGSVDAAENLYLTGVFSGSFLMGATTLASYGSNDGYLAKISPPGTVLWAQAVGGPDFDDVSDVAVDAAGNAYVTGSFSATAHLGSLTLTSAGNADVLVASFTPQGQLRWAQQGGSSNYDGGYTIGLDASANVYVQGRFSTNCLLGARTLTTQEPSELFLARLGSTGLATRASALLPLMYYPNPAASQVHLPALPGNAVVRLFDARGRLVRQTTTAADATISVQGLAPGLYTIKAANALGLPMTGKVLVE